MNLKNNIVAATARFPRAVGGSLELSMLNF